MLGLFDHGTPRSIARFLAGHTVTQAKARGWDRFSNGKLLQAAEEAGFDVLLTTGKNIRHQQNLKAGVVAAVNAATPGSYTEVEIPFQ